MTTRRLLIFSPLVVIAFLIQSYFWVPTYEEQTVGNPHRLRDYINGSIGDASLLNPILSADSSSSEIENLVFEGLIDRDRDLSFRGRVAHRWDIHEVALFRVNEAVTPSGADGPSAAAVARLIERAVQGEIPLDGNLKSSLDNIQEVEVLEPEERELTETIPGKTGTTVRIRVRVPARIQLTLGRVDQDLFSRLALLLGDDYFESPAPTDRIQVLEGGSLDIPEMNRLAEALLPAVEHNPVITFFLRPGIRFHDGHVLDARDVRFTFDAIMDPDNLSPRTADYEPVKRVDVVDPLTVKVTYKRLYSPALGTWAMGILPEHLLNREALQAEAIERGKDPETFTMRESRFSRAPVGSGPFRFGEWRSDQHIILDRFDDYWDGAPHYRRYVFRVIPDLLTQEMEFYAGTLDAYGVQPHQVNRLKDDPRFQSFSGPSFGYTYIGYNAKRPPFDDPRVRRALGMAIDVDTIIEYVLYGQAERITGPFVKQTDFYNREISALPFDPEGALRLLREAGWERNAEGWLEKDGKRLQFTLITNSGNDIRKAILVIAQNAWRQLGIDVRTDLLEWSVFIQERVDRNDFDALVLGWSMGIEPDLFQIWHSSQTGAHQLNFVGFADPEADDLILRIRREYDHVRQAALCHRLHEIIARDQPYTFLYVGKWTAVLDKRIVIQKTGADGTVRHEAITPTRTGNYMFDFNRWIKLPEDPIFSPG